MPIVPRLAALAAAISVLAPHASLAMDDYLRAASSAPTAIRLCGDTPDAPIKTADCKKGGYDQLVAQIDKAFDAALAKTAATTKPLLKRDQAWFNEVIIDAADVLTQVDEDEVRDNFRGTLRRRADALTGIADGPGRPGVAGTWANVFGNITVTPVENGAYRIAAELRGDYGSDRRRACTFNALVRPTGTAWFSGPVLADPDKPAGDKPKTEAAAEPAKPPSVKLRRQGETLRIVEIGGDDSWNGLSDCNSLWQATGSYFASGKADVSDKVDTAFVTPTFDCTKPETATDEEICADPDLADNDIRLNRAWKALLPRLDEATRRALVDDQRNWVKSLTEQYPEFLHPAWDKTTSQVHSTADGRDHVDGLQRERIALLDGFDDKRSGLAGVWLAYNAIIKITADSDGSLTATGWKWDQGDWKAGCDYDMSGKVVRGTFRSDDDRKNPDTLERDHAMLIVNRQDDVFAKKRYQEKNGGENTSADEAKCRRRLDNSSTARLFPARSSPDINNFNGSIR